MAKYLYIFTLSSKAFPVELVHFFCDPVQGVAIFLSFCVSAKPHNYNNCSVCTSGVCVGIYIYVHIYVCVDVCGRVLSMCERVLWKDMCQYGELRLSTVTGIHRKHLSVYVCVCECIGVSVCVLPSCIVYNCSLSPPTPRSPLPYPASQVHTRVLDDVLISSSDAKQKISACCTLLKRPLHCTAATLSYLCPPSPLCTLLKPNQRSRKVKCDADYPIWGQGGRRKQLQMQRCWFPAKVRGSMRSRDWSSKLLELPLECNLYIPCER